MKFAWLASHGSENTGPAVTMAVEENGQLKRDLVNHAGSILAPRNHRASAATM